ncbi:hypothetical protein LTS15_006358 [Exophiala xenobiotica]|nr:hypothetical protein LTS15_006358 [Exophiala xenobiotica]
MTSASPKRKRGQVPPLDTKGPLPRLLLEDDIDDHESGSPRTKVARKFEDLDISHDQICLQHEVGSPKRLSISQHPELSAISADKTSIDRSPKTESRGKAQSETTSTAHEDSRRTVGESMSTPSRSKSPPLAGEISDHFWHDAEITGHDPEDPDDDLYGINGIGFRPTPAIAWSRSQRRKQQLTEYKNREAREARQQRSERRKRFISDGEDARSLESSPRKSIRVHFEDG